MTFVEVMADPKGRELVEQIEELVGEKEGSLVRIRERLIRELKEKFGYQYQINDSSASDLTMLSLEEEKAIADYKKAISNTKDPKLLRLYAHILNEEIEHLEELQNADIQDAEQTLADPATLAAFLKRYPKEANSNFDWKKFGKYFDKDGKLIESTKAEYFREYGNRYAGRDSITKKEYKSMFTKKELGNIRKLRDAVVKDRLAPSQYAALRKLGYNEKRWANMTSEQASKIIAQAKQKQQSRQGGQQQSQQGQTKQQKSASSVAGWWREVEDWNRRNGNKYKININYNNVDGMLNDMWDMIYELEFAAPDLYQKGRRIYNQYSTWSKKVDSVKDSKKGENKLFTKRC